MKIRSPRGRITAGALALLIIWSCCSCKKSRGPDAPGQVVKVASFNVRYNNANDEGNLWKDRRNHVAGILQHYQFDVFGAQEPRYDQLQDMVRLSPDYAYLGRSRTGEETSGEFAPIFYNKQRVEILKSGQFWLTEKDRSKPNTGWDASLPRTCIWAKVRHKAANVTFFVFNIHFDHKGTQARKESTQLMLKLVPQIAAGFPYFLLGDFNYDQNSGNYALLENSAAFTDGYTVAKEHINGNRGTLNNWDPNSTTKERIDHIFVAERTGPEIRKHQIITDSFGGKLPSDHFPVMTEVVF